MKIAVFSFGSFKSAPLEELENDYARRLSRWVTLERVTLKDGKARDPLSRLTEEAGSLASRLKEFDKIWLLDEAGQILDSQTLASKVENHRQSNSRWALVIGSSHGLHSDIKAAHSFHWSLSRLTLTHEWCRALVTEQFYRAFCILHRFPYHH